MNGTNGRTSNRVGAPLSCTSHLNFSAVLFTRTSFRCAMLRYFPKGINFGMPRLARENACISANESVTGICSEYRRMPGHGRTVCPLKGVRRGTRVMGVREEGNQVKEGYDPPDPPSVPDLPVIRFRPETG